MEDGIICPGCRLRVHDKGAERRGLKTGLQRARKMLCHSLRFLKGKAAVQKVLDYVEDQLKLAEIPF